MKIENIRSLSLFSSGFELAEGKDTCRSASNHNEEDSLTLMDAMNE